MIAGEEGALEAGAALGAAMGEAGQFLPENAWYLDDVLPVDTAVAVALLLEHRWAIGLRDSIRDAGGVTGGRLGPPVRSRDHRLGRR